MKENRSNSSFSEEVVSTLLREMWYVDGKADALKFSWDCQCDLERLRAEVHEVEERILHPSESMKGPMSPGASPRIYQEGYLAGLNEAIRIVSSALVPEQVGR